MIDYDFWFDGFCRNANCFKSVSGGGLASAFPLCAQNKGYNGFLQTCEMGVRWIRRNANALGRQQGLAISAWTWQLIWRY